MGKAPDFVFVGEVARGEEKLKALERGMVGECPELDPNRDIGSIDIKVVQGIGNQINAWADDADDHGDLDSLL